MALNSVFVKRIGAWEVKRVSSLRRGRSGGTYKDIFNGEVVATAVFQGTLIQLELAKTNSQDELLKIVEQFTLKDIIVAFEQWQPPRFEPEMKRVLVDEGLPTERWRKEYDFEGAIAKGVALKEQAAKALLRKVPVPVRRKR